VQAAKTKVLNNTTPKEVEQSNNKKSENLGREPCLTKQVMVLEADPIKETNISKRAEYITVTPKPK